MTSHKTRLTTALAAAPFIVAACLIILMILSPWTGMIGPASNVFFATGGAAILTGLLAGIAGLCVMRHRAMWTRILIGLSYGPVVVFSLLLIGA